MHEIDLERFTGFAELYDTARPAPPEKIVEILLRYLGASKADHVVDLGSGTGLSTAVWKNRAGTITGIEPNADMRSRARERYPRLTFLDGTSYATGLPEGCADIVTCSQSFHWMEPVATITEVSRILRQGGLFAAYDCSWPVSWAWEAERAYEELIDAMVKIEAGLPESDRSHGQYPKNRHLDNFRASGAFRYSRKLFFENEEPCDAERFINIALSQGHLQKLAKAGVPHLKDPLERFMRTVRSCRGDTMSVSYTLVLGIR